MTKDVNDDFIKQGLGSVVTIGPKQSPTEIKDYETETGTLVKVANNSNWYTTVVGTTISFSVDGTGFVLRHFIDTRGGIWKVRINGVEIANLSTHVDAVPANEKTTQLASRPFLNLTQGTHNVTLEFTGADPLYPPKLADGTPTTARAWIRNSGTTTNPELAALEVNKTVTVYDNLLNETVLFNLLHATSNKEFALSGKPDGRTGAGYWLPDHGTGSVFIRSSSRQDVLFDGVKVTDWSADTTLKEVKSVRIVQKLKGIDPLDFAIDWADIIGVHTISENGLTWNIRLIYNVPTTVTGYGAMFPVYTSFAQKLITSFGYSYDTTKSDDTMTDLAENDQSSSYIYVNADDAVKKDYVVAMTVQDVEKTFRYGQNGRREESKGSVVWIQHRSNPLPAEQITKLYPQAMEQHTFQAGEGYEASATYIIGEIQFANDLLS